MYNPYAISQAPKADAKCDMDLASQILYTVFRQAPVWGKFCDAVNKDATKKLTQIVNEVGDVVPNKSKRSSIRKRTPPDEADPNSGYTFSLEWTGGDGSCASGCSESFNTMVTGPCGHIGGEQNNVAQSASLDTGCGIYSYKITPPPGTPNLQPAPKPSPIPQPGPLVCEPWNYKPACFKAIQPKHVDGCITAMAAQFPGNGNIMKPGSPDITEVYGGATGVNYLTNIHWIEGCTDYKSMCADNPQGKSGDAPQDPHANGPTPGHSISSSDIIKWTYKNCKLPIPTSGFYLPSPDHEFFCQIFADNDVLERHR